MAKQSAQDTRRRQGEEAEDHPDVGGVLLLALGAFQGPKLMKGSPSTAEAEFRRLPACRARRARPCLGRSGSALTPGGRPQYRNKTDRRLLSSRSPTSQLAAVHALRGQGSLRAVDFFVGETGRPQARILHPRTATVPPPDAATGDATTAGGWTASTPRRVRPHDPGRTRRRRSPMRRSTSTASHSRCRRRIKFPTAGAPLFVVRSVKKHQVKIGVAGGSFDDNQAVTLLRGKKVTLVNTATGVRYVLKLVYTGSQPEVIEGFTTAPAKAAATTTTNP